jgi:hypothetical protein
MDTRQWYAAGFLLEQRTTTRWSVCGRAKGTLPSSEASARISCSTAQGRHERYVCRDTPDPREGGRVPLVGESAPSDAGAGRCNGAADDDDDDDDDDDEDEDKDVDVDEEDDNDDIDDAPSAASRGMTAGGAPASRPLLPLRLWLGLVGPNPGKLPRLLADCSGGGLCGVRGLALRAGVPGADLPPAALLAAAASSSSATSEQK